MAEKLNEEVTVGESQFQSGEYDTIKTSRVDVEKIEEIEITFKFFSFHRLQAIGSLFVLIAISMLPLFLLGGSLGILILEYWGPDFRLHRSGYWRPERQDVARISPFPRSCGCGPIRRRGLRSHRTTIPCNLWNHSYHHRYGCCGYST